MKKKRRQTKPKRLEIEQNGGIKLGKLAHLIVFSVVEVSIRQPKRVLVFIFAVGFLELQQCDDALVISFRQEVVQSWELVLLKHKY